MDIKIKLIIRITRHENGRQRRIKNEYIVIQYQKIQMGEWMEWCRWKKVWIVGWMDRRMERWKDGLMDSLMNG